MESRPSGASAAPAFSSQSQRGKRRRACWCLIQAAACAILGAGLLQLRALFLPRHTCTAPPDPAAAAAARFSPSELRRLQLQGRGKSAPTAFAAFAKKAPVERWAKPKEARGGDTKSLVPSLYPTWFVGWSAPVRELASNLTTALNTTRVVDLVLIGGGTNRQALLFVLAYSNSRELRHAVQVLPRKRDNRQRFRVIGNFTVDEDEMPKLFRVSGSTDPTSLADAMRFSLKARSDQGNVNLARTVRLEMFKSAGAVALLAIEQLFWEMRREITFVPRFEPSADPANMMAGKKGDTPLVITVSST